MTRSPRREPLFARAERSCLWELTVLAAAAHPSVAAMARTLLAGAPVVYTGDPLRDLSLTAFLDKFVQRKPKARARSAAASALATGSRSALREPGAHLRSAAGAAPAKAPCVAVRSRCGVRGTSVRCCSQQAWPPCTHSVLAPLGVWLFRARFHARWDVAAVARL